MKIRIEFETEPANVSIDPETVSIYLINDNGEVTQLSGISDLMLNVGSANEFIMRKIPSSQITTIPLK